MSTIDERENDAFLLRVVQFRAGSVHMAVHRINGAMSDEDMRNAESCYDDAVRLLLRAYDDLPGRRGKTHWSTA